MSETVADIIKEMREMAGSGCRFGSSAVLDFADRIEAAYKNLPGMWIIPAENAKLREENAELRTENAQLTEAMSYVVGCADSTCGGMDVCRTCKVAQFTGGAK